MRITTELDTTEAADGTRRVRLVFFSGTRVRWTVPHARCTAKAWDNAKRRVRFGVTNSAAINERIHQAEEKARRIAEGSPGITPAELRTAMGEDEVNGATLLHEALTTALEANKHRWAGGTVRAKVSAINEIKQILPHTTLASFGDHELLKLDRVYATKAQNTHRAKLKRLSALYALACKLHKLPMRVIPAEIAPPEVETIKVHYTKDQVERLRAGADGLPTKRLRLAAHTWLLQHDLGGLRIGDTMRLNIDMEQDGAYRWIEGKVKRARYHPIRAKARATLDKYSGNHFALPWLKQGLSKAEEEKAIESATSVCNTALAEVARILDLPVVSTHNARHTAAERLKRTTDIHTASKVLGHAKVSQTERYLAQLDTSLVDDAIAALDD